MGLYELCRSDLERDVCSAGPLVDAPFDEDNLVASGEISNWPNHVRVEIACDGKDELDRYVFAARGGLLHYVTSSAALILERMALRGLQLLPLRPAASSPCGIDEVFLLHVTNRVSALDVERTEFAYYRGKSKRFAGKVLGRGRPVLRAEAIPLHLDIFRLAEARTTIYVSERFREACLHAGIRAWSFSPAVIRHQVVN
jgi:hypothetical protein